MSAVRIYSITNQPPLKPVLDHQRQGDTEIFPQGNGLSIMLTWSYFQKSLLKVVSIGSDLALASDRILIKSLYIYKNVKNIFCYMFLSDNMEEWNST